MGNSCLALLRTVTSTYRITNMRRTLTSQMLRMVVFAALVPRFPSMPVALETDEVLEQGQIDESIEQDSEGTLPSLGVGSTFRIPEDESGETGRDEASSSFTSEEEEVGEATADPTVSRLLCRARMDP